MAVVEKHKLIKNLAGYKRAYFSKSKDVRHLKNSLTSSIQEYDKVEKKKQEMLKDAGPDDDGWTVVTRVGKSKGAPRTEVEDKRVKEKDQRKRKRKELPNFYAFQKREGKRQKIEQLQQQFQQDRSKVEQMKAQRKFKPF